MNTELHPITYKQLHEYVAGYNLDSLFFTRSNIDPNAPVKCSCNFNDGHEEVCDLVLANEILRAKNK